ncbi:MAG: surface-adhesin E family protein [Methylotenera sp.]|jgi:hypothetical protein
MKKLTILILSLMCSNVMAAWTQLEDSHEVGITAYANKGKIRSVGLNKVTMSHLLDFKNKQKTSSGLTYQSIKQVVEYDCDEEHFRSHATAIFAGPMGSGKVVTSIGYSKQWQPIESNTLEATLWEAACNKQRVTKHD